jgi:predicted ATPase
MATRNRVRGELLERADELAALESVVADLEAGGGRFAVIEGAAGIGKSSLLAEGRARAADAGLTVLRARGTEIERPLP